MNKIRDVPQITDHCFLENGEYDLSKLSVKYIHLFCFAPEELRDTIFNLTDLPN